MWGPWRNGWLSDVKDHGGANRLGLLGQISEHPPQCPALNALEIKGLD